MKTQNKFERALNSPFFKYMNRLFWLFVVNFIFCLVSVLSLLVLFIPGLVSLHTIAYKMIHDEDDVNPVIMFFKEIKEQWSFSWRLSLLTFAVLFIATSVYYFDILYMEHFGKDLFSWFSIIFMSIVLLVGISIFINLMLYNSYIKDDTFKMMILKSALITSKKLFKSILNLAILIAFSLILYLFPILIPFFSFSFYIYIIEAINRKMYQTIALEEHERMIQEENLFLPIKVESEDKE